MAEEKRALDWADATRGGCLGALLQWVAIGLGLTITIGSGSDSTIGTVLVWAGIPIFFALLLVHPRTRRTGAAFLVGIAVGSIVGSGLCVGILAVSAGL
jgi:hypothetical protein